MKSHRIDNKLLDKDTNNEVGIAAVDAVEMRRATIAAVFRSHDNASNVARPTESFETRI